MQNIYSKIWKELEKKYKLPTRVCKLISIDYDECSSPEGKG